MRCLGRQDTPSPELPGASPDNLSWQELKDKEAPVTQNDLATKSPTEQQQAPLAKAQSSKTKVTNGYCVKLTVAFIFRSTPNSP